MDIHLIISTIIGIIASALTIWSFQRRETRQIFFLQIFSTLLWVCHFTLISALSGALMNAANMVKAIALVYLPKKYILFFTIAYISLLWVAFYIYFFEKWTDIFPLISGTLGALIMFVRDNRYIVARASIIGAICWIIYGLAAGSIPALMTDSFILISIFVGMKRNEEKPFKFFRLHP